MSEYKEELIFVTDELGDKVAEIKIEAKELKSLTLSPEGDYQIFTNKKVLEMFKREKFRESLTLSRPATKGLFQQIIGEDCILVRNDDGTAMVLVKENGKWRLAE